MTAEKQKTLTVNRREMKYLLTKPQSVLLQQELSKILMPDNYARGGYYRVRSLYFDSLENIDFHEKLCGAQKRKKIRLRIYGADKETVKLELKEKDGAYQKKLSLFVTKEEALALIHRQYHILLERTEETARLFYVTLTQGAYRPAAIVEYDRRAFVHPEFVTRVTFDEKITHCMAGYEFFRDDLPLMPVDGDQVILEVKFNGTLVEPVRAVLGKYGLSNLSVSKYVMARGGI